ncbi:MAG TPA: ribulokinase [Myxococcales bacterium]
MRDTDSLVLGIDFGTDSVRSVLVRTGDGSALSSSIKNYPRWQKGLFCDPVENRFRQHPLDYLETMEASVIGALEAAGGSAAGRVRGIAVDTTGSSPVMADARGRPLALRPGFEENPNAMFLLWKDHTAVAEAEEINRLARSWGGPDYTKYVGGIYSSEWFWAKALHVLRQDPAVAGAADTILEHCDWMPAVLTGCENLAAMRRSRCAAGHKAMWHADYGGYPADEFLAGLHPRLPALKASLGHDTFTTDTPFGTLCREWATRLGLPRETVVAVGAFDAHVGAVGAGIRPHRLVKVMGTSTCDVLVVPKGRDPEKLVQGICGQVDGSVVPGAIGYEAGQSAFGDVYAWFRRLLAWPLDAILPSLPGDPDVKKTFADGILERIIPSLEKAALEIPPEESAALALDWMNGRRTPDANQRLKGAIAGISLGTDAPRIYRALVEATAYGSRAIVERFRGEGIRIDGAIAVAGVARKSPFVMQTVANVMDMEIEVPAGDQAVALGAAMFAATAAGVHAGIAEAQRVMSSGTERVYRPDPQQAKRYDALYARYLRLGAFVQRELTPGM